MAKILHVHPLTWEGMKNHWWQFVSAPLLFRSFKNDVASFEAHVEAAGILIIAVLHRSSFGLHNSWTCKYRLVYKCENN